MKLKRVNEHDQREQDFEDRQTIKALLPAAITNLELAITAYNDESAHTVQFCKDYCVEHQVGDNLVATNELINFNNDHPGQIAKIQRFD